MTLTSFSTRFLVLSSLVVMTGSTIAHGLNYVFTILMARLLTPESFGDLIALLAWIAILVFPASVISMHVARRTTVQLTHTTAQSLQSITAPITTWIGVGLLAVSGVLALAHTQTVITLPWSREYSIALVGIVGFSLLTALNKGLLHGAQRFSQLSLLSVAGAVFKLVLALVFVHLGFDVFGVLLAIALGSFLTYGVSQWFRRHSMHVTTGTPTQAAAQPTTAYLQYIFTALFLLLLLKNLDIILVKQWLSAVETGYYGILSTAGKVILFGTISISGIVFPSAVQAATSGSGQERRILLSAIALLLAIAVGATSLYMVIPELIITTVFGASYLPAAQYLGVMGVIASLWAVIELYVRLLIAAGNRLFLAPFILCLMAEIAGLLLWHDSIGTILNVLLVSAAALAISLVGMYQQHLKRATVRPVAVPSDSYEATPA